MPTTRRNVLKAAAAAPLFVPSSAFGANDRLTFAAIGTGSRGGYLHESLMKLGAQCVAVCDVYKPNLEKARSISPAGVKTFVDHHDALALKGLDFVMIGAPDHHHYPMLVDSLKAGVDAYLEKPVSRNLDESAKLVAAMRDSKQIVQVGMQRRSTKFIQEARQFLQDGAIGEISLVEAYWNWHFDLPLDNAPLPGELDWQRFLGAAPKRAIEPRRFRWWRAFWDYCGGNCTDQGTHLMDVVQWLTGSEPPMSASCHGKVINAPGAEVPNVFSAVFEYPKFLATWTLDYRSAFEYDWWIQFRGEKGTLVLNRFGSQLWDSPGGSPTPWTQQAAKKVKDTPGNFDTVPHLQNFLDSVRSRKQPNSTVEVATKSVAGPHLANIAYREQRRVKFANGKVS